MTPDPFPALGESYLRLLLDDVVPFWQRHGTDAEHGGFFTCLDRDGSRFSDDNYVWLQGRAVWMYATLYREVRADPAWLAQAEQGWRFLMAHAVRPDGRVWFRLARDGTPIQEQRKIYGAVFLVLAGCALYRATGNTEALTQAVTFFRRIQSWLERPEELGRLQLPGTPRGTWLADPMVQLGMIEELAACRVEPALLAAVEERALATALTHIEAESGLAYEFAPLDGKRPDTPEGRLLNPGHAIEMGWFLAHLAERRADTALMARAEVIVLAALERGWDAAAGGLFYFVDSRGRPPMALEASMKLWWPHCEAIYACLLFWRLSGDESWKMWHDRLRSYALATFADPVHGEWYGYCDRDGRPTHQLKGGAYKGFYHLPRALLLSWQRSVQPSRHAE